MVTIVIDTPERIRRWFAIVDELTDETGLVTSEMVPAFHATGPGRERGGPHLAQRLAGDGAADLTSGPNPRGSANPQVQGKQRTPVHSLYARPAQGFCR